MVSHTASSRNRRQPGREWLVVPGLVVAFYLFIGLAVPRVFDGLVGAYVVQPLLWFLLVAVTLLLARYGRAGRLRFKRTYLWLAMLIGAFQISLMVGAGLLLGFGHSPYSFAVPMVFVNLLFMASALGGMELSRAYLVSTFRRRRPILVVALTAVLYTVVMIPLTKFGGLGGALEAFTFLGGTIIPLLAMNLFASFLALMGGPAACLGYVGVLQLFEWFSPILPDLPWAAAALVGVVAPSVGFLIVQGRFQSRAQPERARSVAKTRRSSVRGWLVVAVVCLVMVWFGVGFLGVRPTVVGGASMEPAMELGDIAVVREVRSETIEVDDVVSYRRLDGVGVLHRVVGVQNVGDSRVFITKGDANDTPDMEPVRPSQIKGKVVFVIPKLGWVGVAIRNLFD